MIIPPIYIPLDLAKLLRKHNFDVECNAIILNKNCAWYPNGHKEIANKDSIQFDKTAFNTNSYENCPEQYQIIEWFFSKHVHIWVNPIAIDDYKYTILIGFWLKFETEKFGFKTKEDAFNEAFKYALSNKLYLHGEYGYQPNS